VGTSSQAVKPLKAASAAPLLKAKSAARSDKNGRQKSAQPPGQHTKRHTKSAKHNNGGQNPAIKKIRKKHKSKRINSL